MKVQESRRDLQDVSAMFLRSLPEAWPAGQEEPFGPVIARAQLPEWAPDETGPGRLDRVDRRLGAPQDRQVGEILRALARKQGPHPEDLFHCRATGAGVDQRSEGGFQVVQQCLVAGARIDDPLGLS